MLKKQWTTSTQTPRPDLAHSVASTRGPLAHDVTNGSRFKFAINTRRAHKRLVWASMVQGRCDVAKVASQHLFQVLKVLSRYTAPLVPKGDAPCIQQNTIHSSKRMLEQPSAAEWNASLLKDHSQQTRPDHLSHRVYTRPLVSRPAPSSLTFQDPAGHPKGSSTSQLW